MDIIGGESPGRLQLLGQRVDLIIREGNKMFRLGAFRAKHLMDSVGIKNGTPESICPEAFGPLP